MLPLRYNSQSSCNRKNKVAGIIDPPENIHGSYKVVLEVLNPRSKAYDLKRGLIKRIDSEVNSEQKKINTCN